MSRPAFIIAYQVEYESTNDKADEVITWPLALLRVGAATTSSCKKRYKKKEIQKQRKYTQTKTNRDKKKQIKKETETNRDTNRNKHRHKQTGHKH